MKNIFFRRLHFALAPMMMVPLAITALTGSLFQVAVLTGNSPDFLWLLAWHRGHFGPINLEAIYPFLNAFGMLLLIVTGVLMWWPRRFRSF